MYNLIYNLKKVHKKIGFSLTKLLMTSYLKFRTSCINIFLKKRPQLKTPMNLYENFFKNKSVFDLLSLFQVTHSRCKNNGYVIMYVGLGIEWICECKTTPRRIFSDVSVVYPLFLNHFLFHVIFWSFL